MGLATTMIPFLNLEARFARNLRADKRAIHIDPVEQARIRQELLVLMERYPLPENLEEVAEYNSGWLRIPELQLPSLRPTSFAMGLLAGMLVVSGSGAMAYVAQGALPGDPLYGVKINVNERVESALAFGVEAKGEVAARHTERRLQEATILVSQGRFTQKLNQGVEKRLDDSLDALEGVLTALNEEQKFEAASRLQTTVEGKVSAHADILDRLRTATKQPDTDSVENLRKYVKENQEELKQNIEDTAERVKDSDEAVRSRVTTAAQTSADQTIQTAGKTLDSREDILDDATSDQARGEIARAEKSYKQGESYLKNGLYAEAAASFYHATSMANKALVIMKTNVNVDWGARADDTKDEQNTEGAQQGTKEQTEPGEPEKEALSGESVSNKETAANQETTNEGTGSSNLADTKDTKVIIENATKEIANTDMQIKKTLDQKLEAGMNQMKNELKIENFFPFSSE